MEYITAGESHGPNLTAIVTGVPAGLPVSVDHINSDLARRQAGYGRGGRMVIEKDTVRVTSGIRFGRTIGSPIALEVANRDWENWTERMAAFGEAPRDLVREVTPRPGHADLVGALRTNTDDCRNILERASARETAARVAAAGVAREFLAALGVEVMSYVVSVGDAAMPEETMADAAEHKPLDIELSEMRCPDAKTTIAMKKAIDRAKSDGESLGGTFRIVVCGLAPGLGTYATGADRLTSRLGAALFSIPAIKGVEFGLGFQAAARPGSQVHDPIVLADGEFRRTSNNAGGLEGGMTTGMPLVITAAMKPIPTLMTPLETVNLDTLCVEEASKERSDVCAVPAAAVVAEGEVAFGVANGSLEAFGCAPWGAKMAERMELTRPVFFVGFMGAGKTSVARRLARTCGAASVDMDTYIERREGKKVKEIFAEGGEEGFRAIETDVLRELGAKPDPLLISCGGGVVVTPAIHDVFREAGFVVYLEVTADEAASRISDTSTRPLFQNLEAARARCEERLPLYEAVADVRVSTAGKSVPVIAREVQRILEKEGILCPQQR